MALVAALLFCGCNPNAPKYESILDEVLSCMVPDGDSDGVHLLDEDVAQLKEMFRYHFGFEKAPDVKLKDLRVYLHPFNNSYMFDTPDGVEAFRIEDEIYRPAVDSLCAYAEFGGTYPTASVLKAIYHLQEQYAKAMEINQQMAVGAVIWLNRFTQQAVKYCPDIRFLTDNYDGIGADYVGIIEMPEGEVKPLTNIIVTDFNGNSQISFGYNMFINRVDATYRDGSRFLLFRDGNPKDFEAFVLAPGVDRSPKTLAMSSGAENRKAIQEWMAPASEQAELRLFPWKNCALDLIIDEDGHQEARTLRYVVKGDTCRFVFDPKTDVTLESLTNFKEIYRDLDVNTDALLDSLSNPASPKWDKLFSVKESFIRDYLPGEYSHGGKLLAIEDGEMNVAIVDYSRRHIMPYRLEGDRSSVISVQFSPDDKKVLVQTWSGRIALFDVRTGDKLAEARTKEREIDTRTVFDWNQNEGYVGDYKKLIRLKLDEGMAELVDTLDVPIYDILPYRDGELLLRCDEVLVFYNPCTKTETKRIPLMWVGYQQVALSPNRRFALIYDPEGFIKLMDTEGCGDAWTTECTGGYCNKVGFSDDGNSFIFIDGDRMSVTERTIYTND